MKSPCLVACGQFQSKQEGMKGEETVCIVFCIEWGGGGMFIGRKVECMSEVVIIIPTNPTSLVSKNMHTQERK